MKNILFAVVAWAAIGYISPDWAFSQAIKVETTEGKTLNGELMGYKDGKYLLKIGPDFREIEDREITNVVITKFLPIEPPPPVIPQKPIPPPSDLPYALKLMENGYDDLAYNAFKELLKEEPGNRELIALASEADYRRTESAVKNAVTLTAKKEILTAYAERTPAADRLAWAEQQLRLIESELANVTPVPVGEGIENYFPCEPGTWLTYKRRGENIIEKIVIDNVQPQGNGRKLSLSHEKSYKGYSTSQTFELYMSPTSLSKSSVDGSDILLKAPVAVGTSWTWKEEDSIFKREVTSVTGNVTTPAGVFKDCLVVEFTTKTDFADRSELVIRSTSYYAPGVGLVKLDVLDNKYSSYSIELIDHGRVKKENADSPSEENR